MTWVRAVQHAQKIFVVAALVSGSFSCAPGFSLGGPQRHFALPSGHPPPDQASEEQAQALLQTWQSARKNQDTALEDELAEKIRKHYVATDAAAVVFEHDGRVALARSDFSAAVKAFEAVLFHRPQYARLAPIRAEYAVLLVRVGRAEDGLALWRTLPTTDAADSRLHVGQALLKPLVDAGLGRRALELMVELCSDPLLPKEIHQELYAWAREVAATSLSLADVEALFRAHQTQPDWASIVPTLGLRLAKIRYHTGEHDEAERIIKALQRQPTDPQLEQQVERFAQLMHSRFEIAPTTIGALLPLTGRFGQFGERSLAAIRLALNDFPDFKLIVKDTQGEPHAAAEAIDSLVFEHHAIAAIGPLFSNEAAAAALKAEELGLPLLSLSHREGLSDLGKYVFRTALTVAAQAQALARVAMEDLGMTRFAMLYPKSRYGVDFAQAFWDEVDRRHGEIRGVESYEPQQTTFREPVRRLIGRWYLNARPEFHAGLEELKERHLPSLKMRAEVERLDKKSTPIIDFEALVIPDSGRQLGLVAPAVAFEDVLLSHDPKTLDKVRRALGQPDLQPITLLGGSTWNSSQTLDSCDQYCEDGVFVDAFFSGSPDLKVRDFVTAYSQVQGSEPLLSEAQAYDTAGFLRSVIGAHPPADRAHLRQALLDFRTFVGVCGPMRLDENGEAQKTLQTLSIRNHNIVPLPRRNRTGRRS